MTKNTNTSYTLVCGLEIHAELKTQSKMFCSCKNDPFHAQQPNIYTCPVCLGMPGGLPVANKKAIDWTIKLGLALNCQINLFSKFDRKHYFYPDLPKGYQISQYDIPFCENGYIETSEGRVGIRRIHLEEDTGKLLHKEIDGKKVSLIDFNRGGVPLVEVVTEPDIKSANQAKEYGKKLRQILRYLDIADCDMEQGGMRLEANISLADQPDTLPNYKVEVKNINSFRYMEQAINFEVDRQAEILDKHETPIQETRGFNPNTAKTFSQRIKEDAQDYRYFPDPDLAPIHFTQAQIDTLQANLPELPEELIKRWHDQFQIETKYADQLIISQDKSKWWQELFELAVKLEVKPNDLVKAVINKKFVVDYQQPIATIIANYQKENQTDSLDESELSDVITQVINQNPNEVSAYQAGKIALLNFFIGQVMRKLGKKVEMTRVKTLIEKALS